MGLECKCELCATASKCNFRQHYLTENEVGILSRAAQTSRGIILDMLRHAGGGHLGMAMGCGEIGAVLFGKFLRINPRAPRWMDRDRFILSAGHGSAFLYAWLHLAGFDLSTDELAMFRKAGSRCCGHPEFFRERPFGVEATTGPLGQGIANGVGMAISQKKFANTVKSRGIPALGCTVCLAGDGCMQEGVALEAMQLAGHWQLDNLILIYDSNSITLDGPADQSTRCNCAAMLRSFGWHVQEINGHDVHQIGDALIYARTNGQHKPQAIIAKTRAGKGISRLEGTHAAHGCALGKNDLAEAKEVLYPGAGKDFFVASDVRNYFTLLSAQRNSVYEDWQYRLEIIFDFHPEIVPMIFDEDMGEDEFFSSIPPFEEGAIATRVASGKILQYMAKKLPKLLSASADLFTSTRNYLAGEGDFTPQNPVGRNIQCGIREHAMGAVLNGISYDAIFRPIGSTFLAFSDYLRPAIRLAAMAQLGIIYIFTHDSIAVGADGPTHQPVEMLSSLRAIPNLDVLRPADGEETIGAYAIAVQNQRRPTALILSRQDLPMIGEVSVSLRRSGTMHGAYVIKKESKDLQIILIASGSELQHAMEASRDDPRCRVVSMPSMEVFERQSMEYRDGVLPPKMENRIFIEAAQGMSMMRYARPQWIISVENFGENMDGEDLMNKRNITVEAIREKMSQMRRELA
jgi:transketolase